MKASNAPERRLRFVCGSRNDDIVSTSSSPDVMTAAEPMRKRQRAEATAPSSVEVRLVELIRDLDEANDENDKHYGLFLWPSALLLSRFVAREADWLCREKVVLELGCGTGLPSILAALCGAATVYLTDRVDAADIQRNAEANLKLNALGSRAKFLPLTWGDLFLSDEIIAILKTVEVILAADCFYRSEDFEKVLATVAFIFRCSVSTSCKFYFTYQLRSINRSIAPLLSRWGLKASPLDKSAYFVNVSDVGENFVHDFDSIFLYEVEAQS